METLDEPRLLHRRSQHGYTRSAALALTFEPEAIGAEAQLAQTRKAADRELATWATSRLRLLAEVEHLRTHTHSPTIARSCRALAREVDALELKLAG